MYYNKYRKDYGVMALEIVDRAEDEDPSNEHKTERSGKVNNVREKKCYNCNKSGHVAKFCRSRIQDSKVNSVYDKDDNAADVFNVNGSRSRSSRTKRGKEITWILDSGSSLHFVNDQELLQDMKKVSRKGVGFNDSVVCIENEGKVNLKTEAGKMVQITEVNYHSQVKKNLLSYAKLESKGCVLQYEGKRRYLINAKTKKKLFEVFRRDGVLQVKTKLWLDGEEFTESQVLSTQESTEETPKMKATLMEFHHMLGHLAFDKILKLSKDPRYGLEITDDKVRTCVACAQGKQTKNQQSKKDSGKSAPNDRIGGLTSADCKGPMTPADRNGNRYFSLFIDYLTNVMRVFLAKTKSDASSQFGHFMAWFERNFDCRLQVLRTDGGKEFRQMDLLCERLGIERQKSEPYNQASNGKAERSER
jgi:hypothetical protein